MDNLSHLIWDEYDRINNRLNTEAGLERFPEIRFKREYTIFRPGHFTADRIFELNDKMELPTNSIIHVLDNISHLDEEPMDIPRLEEHPLIDQESFRKYIYHVRNFTTDGPLLYEDKYIFRQSGLPAHLLKFRSQNGSRFRYPLTIDELPSRREVLLIINHNPLFRARFFGRLQTFRKLTLIWTSLLNTVCRLASLKKNQYISIPWGEEIYPKNLFIRNRDVLTYSTVKYPEDPHYFIMMHLINFLWKDASTSIFRQLPEDVLQQLNLILTINGKYVIFNLAEIQQMNDKNRVYYKFINLLNMLSVLGRPVDTADKKKLLEDHFDQSGVSSSMYENNTEIATIEPKESVTESSESEYAKDNNAEEVLIKIAETIPSSQPKPPVIRNIQPSPISVVPLSKQELQQPKQLISVPKNVTGIKRTQQNSKGMEEFTQDFLKETDKETEEFIERQEQLTLPQKKRYQRLSNKYKELTLDGVPLQKIMLQNSDISLEPAAIDPKKMGYLPDESACTSSVLTFDHSYLKKSFNKHLVETITGFRKQGVFLTDIKTRHENDRMNNFIHYTLKYEDINGKQSTVKFRLPQINRDGRLRIDGKYHVLKKQRINLPIVKISDTEVSLSSNYNKTRVERNTNKAHNFFAFIDNLINSDKSSAIIEFGKCATNLPLPYEYSCLAERYRSISFVQNNISWQLWFDYNNRADHFDDKEDKLLLLEKEYGIYIGKTQDEWLFMDANCQIRSVYKNNGENPQFSYATLTDILRESLKEGETIAKKAVTEWVNVKILDKMLPVIFLLGFQYGLRNTLDYLGIEYTITEARNKTIVGTSASENTPVVGNESISGSVFSFMLWFLRLFYSSWARLNKYENIVYYWCNGMVDPKKGKFIFRSVLLCYFDPKENKPAKYLQTFPELTHKEYNIVVPRRLPIIKTWKGNFLYIDDILKLLPDFARDLKKRTKIDSKYKRLLDKNLYAFYWSVHKTLISYLESKGCEFYVDKTIKEHEDLHGNKYRSGKESFDFDLDDIANYTDPLIAQEALEDLDGIKYSITESRSKVIVGDSSMASFDGGAGYHVSANDSFVKKYGLLSPRDLYEQDKKLFHENTYVIYRDRARDFLKKSTVTDEDILTYLDSSPKRKPLTSRSIFWSFIPAKDMPHAKLKGHEYSLPLDTIKKYALGLPIIVNGPHLEQVTWEKFEEEYQSYRATASEGALQPITNGLNYGKTLHFAVDSKPIPYSAFSSVTPIDDLDNSATNNSELDTAKYIPKSGDIAIRFADRILWFNRYPLEKSLIVCGLEYFDCSQYSLADFESKDIYYQLLVDKNMSTNYLKGITSFFDLFVDGMTYEVLRKMHESTTFRDLLIRSAQLLSTTDFLPPSSKENHRIRGFEQLNAIIYNEMSRQLAAYQAKRGKANVFTINPDAVFLRVISNASLVASEGANPLQCVKEATYMTYAGIGGRSADSFVLRDRAYSPDDIGIISEATVDNQKVAINAQLSMNSGIVDTIGTLETKNIKDLQPADVLSNTALVFPFSTMDDRFCPAEK